jgi:hypothetical protein
MLKWNLESCHTLQVPLPNPYVKHSVGTRHVSVLRVSYPGPRSLDLLHVVNDGNPTIGFGRPMPFGSNPHSEGTGDTPGELSFVSLVGLWPGQ